ncbi:cache domain-containing protein [Brasilonema sp. UFV-L1]|uniref:PDC sensor domain-containing protein n=1 Tax=Brasilonema sp. UFV-L1 TaxID=2234130 RepID=UPI00145EAE69|nr:cache domain-containing protein [Brasilonema sp. UFV-L1]NMG07660.1 hypothetical protein [Brasilonema sp. UFV-L1]
MRESIKKTNWQKRAFYTSLTLCITCFLLSVFGFYNYSQEQEQRLQEAKSNARRQAVLANLKILQNLRLAQTTVLSLTTKLDNGKLNDRQLLDQLQQGIRKNPDLLNLGVAYKPFAHDPTVELYAPFYTRLKNPLQLLQLEDIYKQTQYNNTSWYKLAFVKGSYWGEPYFLPDTSLLSDQILGFYAPFSDSKLPKKPLKGVVFAEFSLGQLKEIMSSLNLGQTGYGFLISNRGSFLYHPINEYVKNQQQIFQIPEFQNNKKLQGLVRKALEGEKVETELKDEITGQNAFLVLQPSKRNGWVVGVVFIKDEALLDSQTKRRTLIGFSLATIWFLVFLSILLSRAYSGSVKSLVTVSFCASILFAAEIGLIWNLALAESSNQGNRNVLFSQIMVNKLLEPQVKLSKQFNQQPPIYIPTGIFVQSLSFPSPNEAFITGYIWQKYNNGIPKKLSRGFIMPDVTTANDIEVKEAYRHKVGNTEVIGWYFESTFRQNFDFDKYPFDEKDVQLRLWHQDFNRPDLNRQVILVPDLESYNVTNPTTKPGVYKDIALNGWTLSQSFLEYQFKSYDTNFGFTANGSKRNFPELTFNLILKRNFLSLFISKTGPLIIVITLLFAMLLIAKNENATEVLAACAGFVFIVILEQVSLREQVVAQTLVYFEYFYLVAYLFILIIGINAILLISYPNSRFTGYKNNLVSKLLYWPILMKILLLITCFLFF